MMKMVTVALLICGILLADQYAFGFRPMQRQATRHDMTVDVAQHRRFSPDFLGRYGRRDDSQIPLASPVVVGIAGGSASGKTTLARAIIQKLGAEHVSFVTHDSYYKDLSHLSMEERKSVNFDHPDSLETSLLVEHILELKRGKQVDVPIYDFGNHMRTSETDCVSARRIIIIDGILIFSEPELMKLMDMKIFVDTEDDIRLIRRINRDIKERQRTVESVIEQYQNTVRPMHQLYVEPSKRGADIIVPAGQGIQTVALDMCVSRLREIINVYQ